MPGIVGLVTGLPREHARSLLKRMVATMLHEQFYVAGTWDDENAGVYVGWIAKKGSFSERMPLRNEQSVLVFSGEEYSGSDDIAKRGRDEQRSSAHRGSYLLDRAEADPDFIATLNGRFHGMLVNTAGRSAVLFNDRFGLQRLYYHEAAEAFYFAAEAKAIFAVKPELRSINAETLGEWISFGCVVHNRSLFDGVHVLPPASAWKFRNGKLERAGRYFDPQEWEQQSVLDEETFHRELRDVFSSILPRYFVADEPVGMSMTGGLDTRMILAWHEAKPGTLPCYTFAGPYRDCHDARVGREVSELAGQSHQTIRVSDEFLSHAADYAERTVYLSEGCTSVVNSRNIYVNQRARQIAPIRMTGNYGGEVLRRLRMFKPSNPADGLFRPELMAHVKQARATYSELLKWHPLTFTAFCQVPWYHDGLLALEETQITTRTPFLDNELVRIAYRAPQSACEEPFYLRLIREGNPKLSSVATDRGQRFDRSSFMAKVRREIYEFSFKAEYAYDYGMPQWMARVDHFLAPLRLERLFLGRHKYAHFRVWYRDVLANYLKETLLDRRSLSRPYLNGKMVEEMVQWHTRGDRNYTREIHSVLTLELLHRTLIDPVPAPAVERVPAVATSE